MKTFIAALVILTAIFGLVIWNTLDLQKTLDEMLSLTEALPTEASDFTQSEETTATVDRLYTLWDREFTRIAFTSGYENCNRADEAIGALFVYYKAGNAADFAHARLILWDSLHRLRMLESFHFDSIL